jgi:cardiolipin synthase (CMP-forming)
LNQLPNFLSVLRLLASPLLAWSILARRFDLALLVTFFAGLSDFLDGYFARHFQTTTRAGAYLDPIADKALLVTAYICLGLLSAVPLWLVVLVLGRDLVIVIGILLLAAFRGRSKFPPRLSGKANTFFQISTVLLVFITAVFPLTLLRALLDISFICMTFFTVLSGADYIRIGIRMTSRKYVES